MLGPMSILSPRDASYIDAILLNEEGRLKPVPSAVLATIPHDDLRYWCNRKAVYGLPTTELVAWLGERIAGRTAIEIGSGNGCLGRALGIPRTDSHVQATPKMRLIYTLQGQPVITYGTDVEQLDAVEAVQKYRPQVVIGQWVTQYISPDEPPPPGGGSVYGIKERVILADPVVEEYLVVGNLLIHGAKSILQDPPQGWKVDAVAAPWIWSRASEPMANCILIWYR